VAIIEGTSGADTLTGGPDNDTINGYGGDDVIQANSVIPNYDEHNVVDGGDGNDTIYTSWGSDTVTGGAGDDTVYTNSVRYHGHTVDGGSGNDHLIGSHGADVFHGGDGDDVLEDLGNAYQDPTDQFIYNRNTMYGDGGNDILRGGTAPDTLAGGAGWDLILGGGDQTTVYVHHAGYFTAYDTADFSTDPEGSNILLDESATAIVTGYDVIAGCFKIIGTGYNDTLTFVSTIATDIDLGAGDDTVLNVSPGAITIHGGDGADVIEGSALSDLLYGDAGVDAVSYEHATSGVTVSLLYGAYSQDTVGAGVDVVQGFEMIRGSHFGDTLTGAADANLLDGLEGDDTLSGVDGNDLLLGGAGADHLYGGSGDDTLSGGDDNDILIGDLDYEGVGADQIFGGEGHDVLLGGDGADVLHGENGYDQLLGGAGGDTLLGGDGIDLLDGGAGADTLVGGAGGDRFVYNDLSDSMAGQADRILDFVSGEDILDLGRIDANTTIDGNQGFVMVQAFTSTAGQATLQYDSSQDATWFLADVNGDSSADFVLLINGHHTVADPAWLL